MSDHEHAEARRRADERLATAQHRSEALKSLIEHHISDENWKAELHRAQTSAERGEREHMLLRFPCELCSDGGRAINAPDPSWPGTLRGEAAEIYVRWERDLRPRGFHIAARILDFPGGVPGDAALFLVWGSH